MTVRYQQFCSDEDDKPEDNKVAIIIGIFTGVAMVLEMSILAIYLCVRYTEEQE
jgi:hypothetical protein